MEKVYTNKGIYFKRTSKGKYDKATRFQTWNCNSAVQEVSTIKNAKKDINCILKRPSKNLIRFKKVSEKYMKKDYS